MVHSMTGYGSASLSNDNYKVSVELKSLNSKFIEINMKLPRSYMREEMSVRNHLTKELRRGKINVVMNVEVLSPDKHKLHINRELVDAYAKDLESMRKDLGLSQQPNLEFILSLPDAMSSDNEGADEEEWGLIDSAFRGATEKMIASRATEGQALYTDLVGRKEVIAEMLAEVRKLLPKRIENIRSRIDSSLQEIKDRSQIDGNRFEQELIYYIEKLDVNEETVRLEKHLEFSEMRSMSRKAMAKNWALLRRKWAVRSIPSVPKPMMPGFRCLWYG